MYGLPIGFYSGLLGLSAIVALVSGAYTLLRARALARLAEEAGGDVAAGPRLRRPTSRGRVVLAAILCSLATCTALILLALIASGVIGSEDTRNSPVVQRP